MAETSLIENLADFACGIEFGALPAEVVKQAKLCVLDTVGCMIAGSLLPDGAGFAAAEKAMAVTAEATILGTRARISAEGAARVNGYHGDILELNDLIGGHASIGNVTAGLAMGEALRLDGAAFLRALVAGIEVTARINLGYRQSNQGQDSKLSTEVGIASPGIPNTFGASVVSALAMGMRRDEVAAALGVAGTLAGWCPVEALSGRGGTIKPIVMGGWPASVGIQAAKYARHGMSGPSRLLESRDGYYATVARAYDPDIVRGSLGWQLEKPRRKWHACCGYNHAPIDGVSALLREQGPELFDRARIELGLIDYAAQRMNTDTLPAGIHNARFHAKYCVALALKGHDLILPEHCLDYTVYLRDPEVVDWIGRIDVRADPTVTHYSKCTIRVIGPEGERRSLRVEASKGYPGNPMSDEEVVTKFKRLTRGAVDDADGFVEKIMALDAADDIGFVAATLAGDRD